MSRIRGLLAHLRGANLTALIGAGLLVAGIAIALAGFGRGSSASPAVGTESASTGALNQVLRVLQALLNRTDDQIRETQARFNGVVYQVFFEQLSSGTQKTLLLLKDGLGQGLQDLFSPAGIITLVLLVLGFPLARRAFDARYPGARS